MLGRCALLLTAVTAVLSGAVVRVESTERSEVLAGKSFGRAGPYERVIGKVYFAIDPRLSLNRAIVDLDRAPLNPRGLVEFSADLYVLQPRDPTKGNGAVLLEVPNRGAKPLLHFYNLAHNSLDPRNDADLGDGFLLEQGYTLVWLGWQFDVPQQHDLLRLYAPVAEGVTGLVRSEYIPDRVEDSFSVADRDHIPYPVVRPVELTVRDTVTGQRRSIPRSQWKIEHDKVVVDHGLEPGRIYELIYESRDPAISGLGEAAIRDYISYLKHKDLRSRYLPRAYAFGASQSGRLLRTFLYEGFNEDEQHQQVFDALLIHVAGAGRGSFNQRFAQPSRDFHAFFNTLYPVDLFPFTDLAETDAETGATGALLARATAARVTPKIFYTNGSYEYWSRGAALIHVSPDGRADAPLPPTTRIYAFAGAEHSVAGFPPSRRETQNLLNPNPYTLCLRALLVAMDNWVRDGALPPPSRYPLNRDGSLTPLGSLRFPANPNRNVATRPHVAFRGDFASVPPRLGSAFPALVPQVDNDGNETAGIRMPEQRFPLAIFTGWNLRSPETGAPQELAEGAGSWIPFAPKKSRPAILTAQTIRRNLNLPRTNSCESAICSSATSREP